MHPAEAARIGRWGRGYGSIQRVDRSLDHLPGCFPRPALRAHLLAGIERGRAANTGQRDQACAALASSLQSGALVGSEPVCCQGAVRGQGLRETTKDNGQSRGEDTVQGLHRLRRRGDECCCPAQMLLRPPAGLVTAIAAIVGGVGSGTHGSSMSRRGNCHDNAVMESFFSTVKRELADRFDPYGDAKMELFDYIDVFYNQRRRHSTLGQISPAACERRANEEGVEPMEHRQGRGFPQAPHPLSFSPLQEFVWAASASG